jgi:hypothetical protein
MFILTVSEGRVMKQELPAGQVVSTQHYVVACNINAVAGCHTGSAVTVAFLLFFVLTV